MPSASKLLGDLVSSAGAISVTSGVANTAITGTITTAQIADSAITTDKVAASAIVTADIADANVTDAKIVGVANTKITGVLTGSQLANTAVTAGVYGGSSNSALITVDSQGRITSASNVAAAGGVTSLNGQSGAIDNTTQYAIGSYVLGRPFDAVNYNNTTIAGSSLYATFNSVVGDPESGNGTNWGGYLARVNNAGNYNGTFIANSLVNTGSWRCVSIAGGPGTGQPLNNGSTPGLWVRYA